MSLWITKTPPRPTGGAGRSEAASSEDSNKARKGAIETAVRQAVLFFEPRITLHVVRVNTTDWLGGRLTVTLEYTVDQTNARSNMVFPFYIDEGTLVSDTPVLAL